MVLNDFLLSCLAGSSVCAFLVGTHWSSFREDCWANADLRKEITTSKERHKHTCCFIAFQYQHLKHQSWHTDTHTDSLQTPVIMMSSRRWIRKKNIIQGEWKDKVKRTFYNAVSCKEVKDKHSFFLPLRVTVLFFNKPPFFQRVFVKFDNVRRNRVFQEWQ